MKAQEAARYAREMEIARAEAEEEKLRRKEAYAQCVPLFGAKPCGHGSNEMCERITCGLLRHACSEQERRAKVEEARAETERILRAQAAEVEAKKADMARRDALRERAKQTQVGVPWSL